MSTDLPTPDPAKIAILWPRPLLVELESHLTKLDLLRLNSPLFSIDETIEELKLCWGTMTLKESLAYIEIGL
jgi:hypothetical protein